MTEAIHIAKCINLSFTLFPLSWTLNGFSAQYFAHVERVDNRTHLGFHVIVHPPLANRPHADLQLFHAAIQEPFLPRVQVLPRCGLDANLRPYSRL